MSETRRGERLYNELLRYYQMNSDREFVPKPHSHILADITDIDSLDEYLSKTTLDPQTVAGAVEFLQDITVPTGSIVLGKDGAKISSLTRAQGFTDARGNMNAVVHYPMNDQASTDKPYYYEVGAEQTLVVTDGLGQTLTGNQEFVFTTLTDGKTNAFEVIPKTSGTLRVESWEGTDDTGAKIADNYYEIPPLVAFNTLNTFRIELPSPIITNSGDQQFTRFSGIDLEGGIATIGGFVGQLKPYLVSDLQFLTKKELANEDEVRGFLNSKGDWDADTNTPTLLDNGGGGVEGDFYRISVAGATIIDGDGPWEEGDWIYNYNGVWNRLLGASGIALRNTVKASVNDTTPSFLLQKLISSDGSVQFAISNLGGNEDVDITLTQPLVSTIQAGANVAVDNTDPKNPIVSAIGSMGVASITGDGVNNADPTNPIMSFPDAVDVNYDNSDSALIATEVKGALDELSNLSVANSIEIVNHVSDISNPHQVSPSQIGALEDVDEGFLINIDKSNPQIPVISFGLGSVVESVTGTAVSGTSQNPIINEQDISVKADKDGDSLTNASINGVTLSNSNFVGYYLNGVGNYVQVKASESVNDSSVSGAYISDALDSLSSLVTESVYGELYRTGNSTQTLDTTPYRIFFNANGISKNTTPDQANDIITVDYGGVYNAQVAISVIAKRDVKFEFYFRVNGTTDYYAGCLEVPEDNACYTLTLNKLLNIGANQTVQLVGKANSDNKNFFVQRGSTFIITGL